MSIGDLSHALSVIIVRAAGGALLACAAFAQAPAVRCDLQLKSTPGAPAGSACLDLPALQAGGQPVQTAGNATRIGLDGFRLCKNAFSVSVPAQADVVFIYDNSGSMVPTFARIDAATGDTSFFYGGGCGVMPPVSGHLTYNTALGPRTVFTVADSVRCTGHAGDPYFARGRVMAQGIDYLATTAPGSTAGAVAFTGTIAHARPPLVLSTPGNAQIVKNSLVLDTSGSTHYGPPLRQANAWLADTTLTHTRKQAIVFISDGAPNDASGTNSYLNAVGPVPIFSIFLGDTASQFARLQDMSARTGGQFYRVDPSDLARMNEVMQRIIQAITVVDMPASVTVTNASLAPPQVSRTTGFLRNPDSSLSLALDSVLALREGLNELSVKVAMTGSDVRTYAVTVKADGPLAPASTETLRCSEQPSLALLNPQGGVDSAYAGRTAPYDVRLVRATSDLATVTVTAASADTTRRPPWGDRESIILAQAGTGAVYRREDYPLNGASAAPAAGNNVLEGSPDGEVTLVWTHPRDPRETASFRMPGTRVPSLDGFIQVVRAADVSRGGPLSPVVSDPIVLRGGASLVRQGDMVAVTHKGPLHNPHGLSDLALDPKSLPTFLFKTASPFRYQVSVYDHLGHFMNSREGVVDSLTWERMRAGDDSMAVALTVLPVARNGRQFATGAYILKAVLTTLETRRQDAARPVRVSSASRLIWNRFGYQRK